MFKSAPSVAVFKSAHVCGTCYARCVVKGGSMFKSAPSVAVFKSAKAYTRSFSAGALESNIKAHSHA